MPLPDKRPFERLGAYIDRVLPGELEAGKTRGEATKEIMAKFNEDPKKNLDDGIRRLKSGTGSGGFNTNESNINHYWYATEAKDGAGTIWTDTGVPGGLNLDFTGPDISDVTINSASGSYIEVSGPDQGPKYNRNSTNLGGGPTFTLRMWIRPTITRSDKIQQLLAYGKQAGSEQYFYLQQKEVGGNPAFNLGFVNTGGTDTFVNVNLDQWYMMTITGNNSTGEMKWYLNTNLILNTSYTGLGNDYRLQLFDTPQFAADATWKGDFKLLAGYNKELNASAIQNIYQYDLTNNF